MKAKSPTDWANDTHDSLGKCHPYGHLEYVISVELEGSLVNAHFRIIHESDQVSLHEGVR